MPSRNRERAILARIISTVGSTLELDEVLAAVVDLLSDAAAVHACFVYLVDEDGERLVLRAAGEPYRHLVGTIALPRGRGLAWWAAERGEPALISENLLDDPRVEYVPELEEERFQSLLCVPIAARTGEVIGVISAHTEAPREFTPGEVEVLVSTASLVAGAIENARLYDEMRTRVTELEALSALSDAIASARSVDELLVEAAPRMRRLLDAAACALYLIEPGSEELVLQAFDPPTTTHRGRIGLAELGPELARGGRQSRVAVTLVADDELLGLLVAEGSSAAGLAQAAASQTATGIAKLRLIDRITEKNLIRDFFEELAGGRQRGDLEGRATRVGCDLAAEHVVLVAEPADERFERALAGALPGSLFHRGDDALQALLLVPPGGYTRLVEAVRRAHEAAGSPGRAGVSGPCSGAASFVEGFVEAGQAAVGAVVLGSSDGVCTVGELGAYRYLLRIGPDVGARDSMVEAVERIAAYDRARGSALLQTLEEFLRRHGSISATSESLFVHQNTLRQRLRRIAELSGLDLLRDDWLAVEIAVKLVRLRIVLGTANLDTPPR